MRIVKLLGILSCVSMALPPIVSAQNWRTPNPNQPNGYRATSAATHFSGSYKVPSQPSNGYHASEARSHAGMNCYTPPSSSSNENSRSSRWGGSRWGNESAGGSQSYGGRFGGERGMFGRNNNSQSQEWGEFYNRRFSDNSAGNNYANENSAQNNYAFQSGEQNNYFGSNQNGISPMQAVGVIAGIGAVRRFMQVDRGEGAGTTGGVIGGFERNVDGGLSGDRPGGFDKIYAPE